MGSKEFFKTICPSQRGIAKAQAKVKWAEAVKTKGKSPLVLFREIKEKSARGGSIIPGEEIFLLTAENSVNTLVFRNFAILERPDLTGTNDKGKIHKTIKALSQLKFKDIQELGSKEANRLVIKRILKRSKESEKKRKKGVKVSL